jgi:hypothetical protein
MIKRRLQVFVSSTYTDLQAERQAAVSAILKAGHIPAGMELFAAGDESQMEVIRRWIDESDVYMLILGGRYGTLESRSGLSYTELEYDYAAERKKPLFAVVATDDAIESKVRTEGSAVLEKENAPKLRIFREKVLGRISSFFTSPQDIRLAVYETLADFNQRYQFTGWISASEIPNSDALSARIVELQGEGERLRGEIQSLRNEAIGRLAGATSGLSHDEIGKALAAIELTFPVALREKLTVEKATVAALMDAFGEQLIAGVHNSGTATQLNTFLYHQVLPRLQLYGLAESGPVPQVAWRRYALTPRGIDFLLFLRGRRKAAATKAPAKKAKAAQESPDE